MIGFTVEHCWKYAVSPIQYNPDFYFCPQSVIVPQIRTRFAHIHHIVTLTSCASGLHLLKLLQHRAPGTGPASQL